MPIFTLMWMLWSMVRVGTEPRRPKRRKPDPPPAPGERRSILWIALALSAVTFLVYLPAVFSGFSLLDDDVYVRQNPHVLAGLRWENIAWAFTHQHAATYHPLTTITHMADVQFFGLNPSGHHLVNVLLHVASSVLLFVALRMLTRRAWPSAFVAAVFALHPQHVESVAWISERKDVLSAFFFMWGLIAYAWYARAPSLTKYLVLIVIYVLGLLSKPMLVTLPFVLLLLDWWPLLRLTTAPRELGGYTRKAIYLEKVPLIALSVAFAIIALTTQRNAGAVQEKIALGDRLSNAVVSVMRYVAMFLWPSNLSVFYPYRHWPLAIVVSATVGLLLITIAVLMRARMQPWLFTGWFWFLVMLLPVIGIVQIGLQSMADRYTYLPTIGLTIAIVWLVLELLPRGNRVVIGACAGVILLVLALRTFTQVELWSNPEALFATSLANAGESATLRANLAHAMWGDGRHEEAVEQLQRVLQYEPNNDDIHWRMGSFLLQLGQFKEAEDQLNDALKLKPNSAPALIYLAFLRKQQGKPDEAVQLVNRALEANPEDASAREILKQFESEQR